MVNLEATASIKDFMPCKPSHFNGNEDLIRVMIWISEMELAFIKYSCSDKLQTTYDVRQFKGSIVHWCNTLDKSINPNDPVQLTWADFLVHFKQKYCSSQNILELQNYFLILKKGNITVDECTNPFTVKMEFSMRIDPYELSKINMYAKGFPW